MKIEYMPEEKSFRAEVRGWLRGHVPPTSRPHAGQAMRDYDLGWQRTQNEGGWAGVSWPAEYGGRGASLIEQLIWHEEYARAGAPRAGACFVGLSHAGPTLIARGTDAQRAFHLPKILKGEVVWCQGFSEPGSGSDLASLSTRAEIDGDELVVNGSKIWTSYALVADYQELLVRTDPSGRKQGGITWVICDMHAPGIELRPILTMTAPDDFHFCQVFYKDVRLPLSNVVGEVNQGWSVANSTLGFERGTGFIADQIQNSELVERLIALARKRPGADGVTPVFEEGDHAMRLAMARAEMAAVRAMTYMTVSRAGRDNPGPEGSLVKLFFSEASQRLRRLGVDLLGGEVLERSEDEGLTTAYLRNHAATIGGGTSDIQRNIVAERVLGLPRGAVIDLLPSPEQQQIIDSVAGYLADALPLERFIPKPTPVPNADRALWPAFAELGVFGLGVSEAQGGVGYTIVEEVLVAREMGRALVSPAILATMIAARVAAAAGDAALGARIHSGAAFVSPALAFTPEARGVEGEYHLIDARHDDLALVCTVKGAGLVEASAWSERRAMPSIDTSLTLERARLGKAAILWADAPEISTAALLLGSAYLVGIAEAAVHDSVDYARVREQFGQPIGAFQAVKHRCADMLALASAAWCLTSFAALTELDGTPDAAFQGIAARIMAADAAFRNAKTNIQNHGGIGFTGEHHAHLFVKRAHVLDRMGGDMAVQKKRLLNATPPSEDVAG